jgi:hypothetical protein
MISKLVIIKLTLDLFQVVKMEKISMFYYHSEILIIQENKSNIVFFSMDSKLQL